MDFQFLYPYLPFIFAAVMGLSILVYVILDGFDLGVGILFYVAPENMRDRMIASIGPFWDANETWLVLAIGVLLVAFPVAHGIILSALYLPVAIMLIGLIARGVAFEFRAKARAQEKWLWNRIFFAGSLVTALSQGYMLGIYVLGLDTDITAMLFGMLVAVCLASAYVSMGAAWLIYKTEGPLQVNAVSWLKRSLGLTVLGMGTISLATPYASPRIFDKWFSLPQFYLLTLLPLLTAVLFILLVLLLRKLPHPKDRYSLLPFLGMASIMILGFAGLAYSFYPYVVPDKVTLYEAASAPESLIIILAGTLFVLPVIIGYSIFSYRVSGGKATALRYD